MPFLDRAQGLVLGAAIGDAMGHPTEFLDAESIRRRFGPRGVEGFALYWEHAGRRFAPYTDDTQMAEIVLRSLVAGGDLDAVMTRMAAGFVEWMRSPQGGHRAPGNACLRGCRRLADGVPWREAGGPDDGGCGSVMRSYPFGLVFWQTPEKAEQWAMEHSKMTHRAPIAIAACAAMAVGTALTLQDQPVRRVLDGMVEAAGRHDRVTAEMMESAILDQRPPDQVLRGLQGWAAHEAIAAAVYVVARHPEDPRSAILEGANAPGDSDSIATLAGALVGGRVGVRALPGEWVREVERSAELLELAKEAAFIAGAE